MECLCHTLTFLGIVPMMYVMKPLRGNAQNIFSAGKILNIGKSKGTDIVSL